MPKPVTIVLLGADRVGKSTIISNTLQKYLDQDRDAVALHFSGPQPHHSNPIEQYTVPFDSVLETMPEFILCDRGFSEVCFYDKFRRHVNISHEWAQAAESYFVDKSQAVHVFFVKRSWEWCLPHHKMEVQDLYPGCSAWFKRNQLEMRKAEHYAYYEYMEN